MSQPSSLSPLRRFHALITYTPRHLRHDSSKPLHFSWSLIFLFGFASTFTVANLYYSHPILNLLAQSFDVSDEQASLVPNLAQAGYACGLLFLCPLGDLLERRQLVLKLVACTVLLWVGLCATRNFGAFLGLTFGTGFTTVTAQLMVPLVGDIAPRNRRATAISVVSSGVLLGILMARVLSGVVSEYSNWRRVYWLALGMQLSVFTLLWWCLPEYPVKNPSSGKNFVVTYAKLLWSILILLFSEPLLVQSCLIGLCAATTFTSFWTTLTFLLSEAPFYFDPLIIGLCGLTSIGALALSPLLSHFVIDRFIPHFSVLLGIVMNFVGILIGLSVAPFTIGGSVVQAFLLDWGLQTSQIANRTAIYGINAQASNRLNTAYMVSVFTGQILGTAIGNAVFDRRGWRGSDGVNAGFLVLALIFWFARGPLEQGWIGWKGGWTIRKQIHCEVADGNSGDVTLEEEKSVVRDSEVGQSDPPSRSGLEV